MNWKTCLTGAGLALLGGILAWREVSHLHARQLLEKTLADLHTDNRTAVSEHAAAVAKLDQCQSARVEMETSLQSQLDRSKNLEAQRDHLRAEIDRLNTKAIAAAKTTEGLRAELETARSRILDLSRQPASMESRLRQCRDRIESLQDSLDAASQRAAGAPVAVTFAGLSRDRKVFALKGNPPEGFRLPCPVALCDRDTVLLQGWLRRIENGHLIGHVSGAGEPASTLVKGKKVFILHLLDHESPP